ncbi:hypothetical protein D9M69_561380 [compost metagenome]
MRRTLPSCRQKRASTSNTCKASAQRCSAAERAATSSGWIRPYIASGSASTSATVTPQTRATESDTSVNRRRPPASITSWYSTECGRLAPSMCMRAWLSRTRASEIRKASKGARMLVMKVARYSRA